MSKPNKADCSDYIEPPSGAPTDVDGFPDYEKMALDVGILDASLTNPVWLNDGAETFGVTAVDLEDGTVSCVRRRNVVKPITFEAHLDDLWADVRDDELTPVDRETVRPEEVVVNRSDLMRVVEWLQDSPAFDHAPDDIPMAQSAARLEATLWRSGMEFRPRFFEEPDE